MQITLFGYIYITTCLFLLLNDSKYLLIITILSAPMQSTGVINFTSIEFGLIPSIFSGMLFICKYNLELVIKNQFSLNYGKSGIGLYVVFSLFTIIFAALKFELFGSRNIAASIFSMRNFTQYAYLVFSVLLYINIVDFIKRRKIEHDFFIKFIRISVVITLVYGLYQFVSPLTSEKIIDFFENREGVAITRVIFKQFRRIQSFALEPSMFAFFLLPNIVLLFEVSNKKVDYYICLLGFLEGVLSFSTSFVVGIVLYCFLFLFERYIFKNKIDRGKKIVLVIVMILLLLLLFVLFNNIITLIIETSMQKFKVENSSGRVRYYNLEFGFELLKEFPLFGIGYGGIRLTNLFSTISSNTGIIGLTIFMYFLLKLFYRSIKNCNYNNVKLSNALLKYFIIMFSLAFISVSEIFFTFTWINIAMIEAYLINTKKKMVIVNE